MGSLEQPRVLRRALIVEDDDALASSLAGTLTARKLVVRVAHTLAEGLVCARDDWDLALVDIRLPDGSGIELCKLLCARRPRPVVIALSGLALGHEGFELARLGVGEYLKKPFDEGDLWTAIERNAGVPLDNVAPLVLGNQKLAEAQLTLRRAMIQEAMARANGSIAGAARLLGISRQAVQQALISLDKED